MDIEYQHSCAESGFPCTVCKLESGLVEWNVVRNAVDGIEGDLALLTAINGTPRDLKWVILLCWVGTCLYRKILVIWLFSNLFYIIYILKLINSISQ